MHEIVDRLEHPSRTRSASSGDECIDLHELDIERLGIYPDKVENLDEPVVCLTMEQCEEIVLETRLSLAELRCSTHRVDDHRLESSRYTRIVTTTVAALELERWTREQIDQDGVIDTKTPEKIINIAICDLRNLDEDILREDLSIAELLGSLFCGEHDIAILCGELVEHEVVKVNFV